MELSNQELRQVCGLSDELIDELCKLTWDEFFQRVYKNPDYTSEVSLPLGILWGLAQPKNIKKYNEPHQPDKVYLLKSDNGIYKIGYSNNVDRRVDQLNRQLPIEVREVFSIECEQAKIAESYLHGYFNDKRLAGEWFIFDAKDVQSFEVQARKIVKRLSSDGLPLPFKFKDAEF